MRPADSSSRLSRAGRRVFCVISVAMGVAGTDVALETADVALMAGDLEKPVYAL